MKILAKCPRCSAIIELSAEDADKRKHCAKCGSIFKVPDSTKLDKALAVIRSTDQTVFVDQQGRVYG